MSDITHSDNIQHDFLSDLVTRKAPVAVYLKNGIKLKGVICGFDALSIYLNQPSLQLIYKTAISTVAPLLTFSMES